MNQLWILIYDNTPNNIIPQNVVIKYNDITYHPTVSTHDSLSNRKNLALTTLFKDDYYLFPLFYEYYKKTRG